jgi:Arc/MetJ-type ribon-helix-helix transcriptional regulator
MANGSIAMDVTLPADLKAEFEQELACGRYQNPDELIARAVRQFFDEQQRGRRRIEALRRIGQAVDQAVLYDRVLTGQE